MHRDGLVDSFRKWYGFEIDRGTIEDLEVEVRGFRVP